MTNTIFDLVESDLPEGSEGFMEAANRAPSPKDNSYYNTIKDYGKTILKGTAEGLTRFGKMLGPLPTGKSKEEEFEQQSEALNELFPTEEDFGQRALRRGLKEAPSMLAFPGAGLHALPRSLAAGFLGEGAKDLGLPEWAQTAAELTAFVGPDITKKLLQKGSNKEIIGWAKKMGMTDEQITPLLQSEFKTRWLSKLTPRRGATEKALSESKGVLSNIYSTIQKSPEAANVISLSAKKDLVKSFEKILFDMPAGVRDTIKKDLKDLASKPVTGDSLMNFFADVNHNLGPNTKQLSVLKQPMKKAIASISPELAEDFGMINNLLSKYHKISSKLKPTMASDITSGILSVAKTIGFLGGIVSGNYPAMAGVVGEKIARKVAQQMLINPHFQQLSNKMIVAIDQNKFGLAKKLIGDFSKELRKNSPEAARELDEMTDEEIMEFLNPHPSVEKQ